MVSAERPRQAPAGAADAALLVDGRCELAECPLWCEREQVLWWTDIESSRLWQLRFSDQRLRHWRLPQRCGSFALCQSGRLLLGLAKGLYLADVGGHADQPVLTPLAPVEADRPALRVNDGRADRDGNFVFGTLNQDPRRQPSGSFYQYSQGHGLRRLALGGVAIPNSLAFSPDGQWLYFCDSLQGRIMRCRYDARSAAVGPAQGLARVSAPASPDGAAVDRDGGLWSAQWGAGRVVRYDGHGRIDHVVAVPASHVSCATFAGPGLDRLCIATARVELAPERRRCEPHAGGIFSAQVAGIAGLPEARFEDR